MCLGMVLSLSLVRIFRSLKMEMPFCFRLSTRLIRCSILENNLATRFWHLLLEGMTF